MTEGRENRRLVAVLGAEPGAAPLERIVGLAEHLRCEIHAAFLEDVALLWSAALPFTRWVAPSGASEPAFEPATVRRAMRLTAEDLRLRLSELARGRRLSCSFAFLAVGELAGAVRERDFLLLTAARAEVLASLPRPPELPSTLPLVVLGEARGSLLLVYAGDPRVLDLARDLALATCGELLLLALAGDAGTARARLREAAKRLGDLPVREASAATFDRDPLKRPPADLIQRGVGLAVLDGAVAGRLLAGVAELARGPRIRSPSGEGIRTDAPATSSSARTDRTER